MPDASSESSKDRPTTGRRGFFREGLRQMLGPLADFVEQKVPDIVPAMHTDYTPVRGRSMLRPPGALPEDQFLDNCYRSGNCIESCPVEAIKAYQSEDSQLAGTPYIDPDLTACVACEAVYCTRACPSGALNVIEEPKQIRIGLAQVNEYQCERNIGEDCEICVEKCPIGSSAIEIGEDNQIHVIETGCVGCGVCQQHCPTSPKSIIVDPL